EDYGFTRPLVDLSRCKATYSSRSKVVRMRILLAGAAAVIAAVAWIPFMPGIRTSISTTSGCRADVMLTPVAPSAASPATSMSGSASRIIWNPRRSRDWSSTSRTRIIRPRRRPGAAARRRSSRRAGAGRPARRRHRRGFAPASRSGRRPRRPAPAPAAGGGGRGAPRADMGVLPRLSGGRGAPPPGGGAPAPAVFGGVGQALLYEPVHRQLHAGGHVRRLPVDLQRGLQSGGPGLLGERVELGEIGHRRQSRARVMAGALGPHAEGLAGDRAGRPRRGPRP